MENLENIPVYHLYESMVWVCAARTYHIYHVHHSCTVCRSNYLRVCALDENWFREIDFSKHKDNLRSHRGRRYVHKNKVRDKTSMTTSARTSMITWCMVFGLRFSLPPLLFGTHLTKSFDERISHCTGCSERECTRLDYYAVLLWNIWIFRCTPSLGHPWLVLRKIRAWNPKISTLTPPDLQGNGKYIHPAKEGQTIHVVLVLKSNHQESRPWSHYSILVKWRLDL